MARYGAHNYSGVTMRVRFGFRFFSLASGEAADDYPELPPFFVLAQLSQHLTDRYHSVWVPVKNDRSIEALVDAPLSPPASIPPSAAVQISASAHLALSFVATTRSPYDTRSYLVPLGEASVRISGFAATGRIELERLNFIDYCTKRSE